MLARAVSNAGIGSEKRYFKCLRVQTGPVFNLESPKHERWMEIKSQYYASIRPPFVPVEFG